MKSRKNPIQFEASLQYLYKKINDRKAFQDMSNAMETLDLANTGLFSLPRIDNHGLRLLNISKWAMVYEILQY